MKRILTPLALAAISFSLMARLDAQYISTLGQPGSPGAGVQYTSTGDWETSVQVWAAMPFSTDAQSYSLTSIEASIHHVSSSGSAPIVALLHAGDGNYRPTDDYIADFIYDPLTVPSDVAGGSTWGTVTFTPTWAPILDPSTNYVFILFVATGGGVSGSYEWKETAATNGFTAPSGGSWLMPAESFSAVFMGDYVYGVNNLPWSSDTGGRLVAAVNASIVPEPSTYALLAGLVALGCVVMRRRHRR
jgi:hypothetical protein